MAKRNNRLITVSTALLPEEVNKIRQLAQAKSLTISELFREGMQWYLANQDKLTADSRETLLEKRMRKTEDRLAALQARTAIDVGMIYHLIFMNMNKQTRDEDIAWAYHRSVERLKKKLESHTKEIEAAQKSE